MSSTNKTSLGLNMWEASDKPVRQDFVNDNTIIDEKITDLNSNLDNVNSNLTSISNRLTTASLQTWSYAELQANSEKSANWNDYIFLMIGTGNYGNIWEAITVPTSYFISTYSGRRVILKDYAGSIIEVYKTSATTIKVVCNSLSNEQTLQIFGAIPK